MRNNSKIYLYIGIGAVIVVILCLGIMAMVGKGNGNGNQNNNTTIESQDKNQTDSFKGRTYEEKEDRGNNQDTNPSDSRHPAVDPTNLTGDNDLDYQDTSEGTDGEDSVSASANNYTFHEGSILEWPVSGNIIINYSMDKMVYFETLDVYKYHPAICIEAAVDTPVVAGATGQVISVTNEADTGLTVGMRIGPEYVIYYGQLKECNLKEGDNVNRGEEFAKVASPTRHYLIEGSHLYLRLERNEEPVNPLSYLDFSE